MTRNIINDGFTLPGRIEPVERLHEGLDFEYRPMLQEQFEVLEDQITKRQPGAAVRLMCAAVAQALASWSEVDESGKPVPISEEAVRRLQPMLLIRLYRIVSGRDASDAPNKATPEERDEYLDSLESGNRARLAESEGN